VHCHLKLAGDATLREVNSMATRTADVLSSGIEDAEGIATGSSKFQGLIRNNSQLYGNYLKKA